MKTNLSYTLNVQKSASSWPGTNRTGLDLERLTEPGSHVGLVQFRLVGLDWT